MEHQNKLPKLTKKQRGFVNDYVKDENGTKAVLNNYNVKDESVASSVSTENLRKPYIAEAIEIKRKSLKQALIDKGITEDYLVDKVEVLLNAIDDRGKCDYTAIDKGLKHASSWYGVENPEDKPKSSNTYNFLFSAETQAEVKLIEDRIKAQLINANHNEN